MARDPKPTDPTLVRPNKAGIEVTSAGDAAIVSVSGLVDENFKGFGSFQDGVKVVVINVAGMTRMTSFGVRQWIKGMDALPKSITNLYLLACPTFFVDQLNMVLNFGGAAQIVTVVAPYTCPSCGVESGETIDVLVERAALVKGGVSEKECSRCGGKLEFDETPESYFSFVSKYAASSIAPAAAQILGANGLYTARDTAGDKPPRIIKLVHGSVTYFRIIGTIGAMFRARPLLVGAEGEVVIDLAEVDRFDALGLREWRKLLKTLAGQVPTVTLVDVTESFLTVAADSFALARNISVSSVLVPYCCIDCGRVSPESQNLDGVAWPLHFAEHVCSTCGGTTRNELPANMLAPLQKAGTSTPAASKKLIASRHEVLSRALTDANVAQAGDSATASLIADDTILGKYKIVRRLSAGGMAEVFLAKQVGIGGFEKPVALKRIQRQLLESRHLAIDMFLNEAKIAGRLMHPNIVQVLDVGEVAGALYLAMEYVHGKDLRDVVKTLRANRTMMPLGEVCYVIREVAQALHHAYWSTDMAGQRLAVVHRDVSPHNIILSYDGTVKLLDFGVAMSAVTEQAETMIVGKWLYMSPEHTTNQALDHRSDLFSLGVIMYLLCTGVMPFAGTDPKDIVKKIRAGKYKPLQQAAPDIPEALAVLVGRLLSPNPDDRPQTGHEVVAALTEITRSYGIESSPVNISRFLTDTFVNETGTTGIMDIVRAKADEGDSFATKKVAIGSGPTQAQSGGTFEDSKSPGSFSPASFSLRPNSVTPGSYSLRPNSMSSSFSIPGAPSPPMGSPIVQPNAPASGPVLRPSSPSSAPPTRPSSPSSAPATRPSSPAMPRTKSPSTPQPQPKLPSTPRPNSPSSQPTIISKGPSSSSMAAVTPPAARISDGSVSIARKSHDFASPNKKGAAPMPTLRESSWAIILRSIIIVVIVIALAVATYIFVKPI
ncbi:MAG: serine/threonine protein kinase [Myxococcales bacterium]|nr:serine/threonine protein kinase [Myxococcales bacterium]